MEKTIKIAITGAESSGKSTLTKLLATHFDAPYVEEFARSYLKDIGTNYTYADVVLMAKKHIELEQSAYAKNPPLVFLDTDIINFKIWFEFYGKMPPEFITKYIETKPYTHSLLLYPNTPWIDDGLRKNENDRLTLFTMFKENLEKYTYPYTIIDKLNNERITQAIAVVKQI